MPKPGYSMGKVNASVLVEALLSHYNRELDKKSECAELRKAIKVSRRANERRLSVKATLPHLVQLIEKCQRRIHTSERSIESLPKKK